MLSHKIVISQQSTHIPQKMKVVLAIFLILCATVIAEDDAAAPINATGTVIGIDLGTTYSCVAIYRAGKVEILPNELGNRITPSVVGFTDQGRIVGDAARNQQPSNPENSVYAIKRVIGRPFDDPVVQRDVSTFPFDVINKEGKPVIRLTERENTVTKTPEEISAAVLRKMKEVAESYLGHTVTQAVITVPAYFNDAQRKTTRDAGAIAGLEVLRIINEPTAAAIAYGLDKEQGESKILVYDLGGGTFDVSLLNIADGVFEVISTNGDTHLGGEDFDLRVVAHFTGIIEKKYGIDISKDKRATARLKQEVEGAKRKLSYQKSTKIEIENLAKDKDGNLFDLSETFTRARFEALNVDLFKKTLKPIHRVLQDAKINKEAVDEVVLVGGSTRIPIVQQLLTEFFNGKALHRDINPDEAIAHGAAVQAGVLSKDKGTDVEVVLLDVTPLTLGMEDEDGIMVSLIKRNTHVPVRKSQPFTTVVDNQPSVLFRIFQGERKLAKHNHLLGQFTLHGLPPVPRGVPEIKVTFELDVNGILNVSAKDVATGRSKSIRITSDATTLSSSEIKRMVEDAEKEMEEEEKYLARVEARHELEQYALSIRNAMHKLKKHLNKKDAATLKRTINRALSWVDKNKKSSKATYVKKLRALEDVVAPIMAKIYAQTGSKQGKDDFDLDQDMYDEPKSSQKEVKQYSSDEEEDDASKVPAHSGKFDEALDKVEEEDEKKEEL